MWNNLVQSIWIVAMSIKLSNNIENIPPSATMLMTQLGKRSKFRGKRYY